MVARLCYSIPAAAALSALVLVGNASGQTKHPLVGCYSPVGNKTIALQVAQHEEKLHMALGYESARNIFFEQTLAHEMSRQELIDKGGFKEQETEKFLSNLIMNDCGSCIAGVIQIKPGERIESFETLTPHVKGRTNYFAFLGIVGTWVNKVDCP